MLSFSVTRWFLWVVGPLPNGIFMAYKWGLQLTKWDDPPTDFGIVPQFVVEPCMIS